MRCPSCQTENPATRKFCRECGGKLLVICPECKSENMPWDKFCGECGQPFDYVCMPVAKEMTFDEKISKIQVTIQRKFGFYCRLCGKCPAVFR